MRIHHPSITALCLALAACSKAPTPGADVAAPAPDAAAVATADAAPVPEDVAPPAPTVVPAELAALPPEASRPDVPLPEGASVRLGAARPFAVRSLHALALAPDGKRLATVSMYESRVTIWSTDTGAIERTLDASPSEHAGDMAFSSDGRLAVIAHDELVLFAPDGAESWRVEPALTGPADNPAFLRAVAFSPDGKLVAVGHNQSAVGLVDAATGKLVRSLKGKGTAFSKVAFSPDGTLVAATGVGDAEHSELRVWSTASGEPALDYAVPSATDDKPFGYAVDLMWLADGRLLTSTSGDALVVWKPGDAAPARASENAISARELAGS
ncbi:MAG: hypothetical protein IT385_15200, partial [Deltaproteobacteria bacterium]|nr:hypothetical protein [Deltaproteobacteria bacterium]